MALPTSYSDTALAQYMIDALEGVAGCFDWTTANFFEQINDVLIAYGASALSSASDIPKLRTIAAYYAWRKAYQAGSIKWMNNQVGEDRRNQNEIWEHIKATYNEVSLAASVYLSADNMAGVMSGHVATIGRMDFINDPYRMASVNDG